MASAIFRPVLKIPDDGRIGALRQSILFISSAHPTPKPQLRRRYGQRWFYAATYTVYQARKVDPDQLPAPYGLSSHRHTPSESADTSLGSITVGKYHRCNAAGGCRELPSFTGVEHCGLQANHGQIHDTVVRRPEDASPGMWPSHSQALPLPPAPH